MLDFKESHCGELFILHFPHKALVLTEILRRRAPQNDRNTTLCHPERQAKDLGQIPDDGWQMVELPIVGIDVSCQAGCAAGT